MKKIFSSSLSCCLFLLMSYSGRAQTHEISIAAAVGQAGLKYDISNGSNQLKAGFQAGLGYTHFLHAHWSIFTGIGLGYYQTQATLRPDHIFSSYSVDDENYAFEYRVSTKGYKEIQKLYALNIPLMMQYQTVHAGKTGFYSRAGLKLSIPMQATFRAEAEEISASGYYPDVNAELTDLPSHGFGTQTGWNDKGDYDFNLSYSLAAEAGVKFRINGGTGLYAGLFIDYGLNNIKKEETGGTLLTYNPKNVSQSRANGVFTLANTTGDVRLISYGIQVRVGFSRSGKAKK